MKQHEGAAEKRYNSLTGRREHFLNRARDSSKLTIPSLIPPANFSSSSKLPTPYQSLGARGVNNLAAKLLLALLPPNSPFFRFDITGKARAEMKALADQADAAPGDPQAQKLKQLKTDMEKRLAERERIIGSDIESSGDRVVIFEALKHLIVGGNALLFVDQEGTKLFHLSRYVVKRDPMGNVLEIVTHEEIAPSALPEKIRSNVEQRAKDDEETDHVNLYTHIKRDGEFFRAYQEVKGLKIPGTQATYPVEATPYIPLRWNRIDGEDYGRGYVEEYLGDLVSLEYLTQAIVDGSLAAAKVLFFVNPTGTTQLKTVAKAPNGAVRSGRGDDVSVLQVQKAADFRVAQETARDLADRLAHAFMLNSSIQRNGERVTAEEIRWMAGELEDALGGVYSILSQEFQLPYIQRKLKVIKGMPPLPKGTVRPTIVTGLEALGRGHDLRKLDMFVAGMAEVLGPEVLQRYINLSDYIKRRATAVGIDTEGLVRTEEEIQAEAAQQQQMAMMQQFGPEAIKQGGALIQEGMKQNVAAGQ